MPFDLSITIGRRKPAGGPIVALSGRIPGAPANTVRLDLMITDCDKVVRIKRLPAPGVDGSFAFSLVEAELAGPCGGLNPQRDWYVFGQTTVAPLRASSAVRFRRGRTGYDPGTHDIRALKRAEIEELRKAIDQGRSELRDLERQLSRRLREFERMFDR